MFLEIMVEEDLVGGSLNLFYKNDLTRGNLVVSGGKGGISMNDGQTYGGTGSIAVGQIVDGTYVDTYHNWTD